MTRLDKAACSAAVDACACLNFAKASRSVTQLFNSVLVPSGLRSTQFALMTLVAAEEPASMPRLVQAMVIDRSTLTRNLKPLEVAGFVRVTRPAGQRGKQVELTEKGRRKVAATIPLWEQAQSLFTQSLGAGRWKSVQRGLNAAVNAKRTL